MTSTLSVSLSLALSLSLFLYFSRPFSLSFSLLPHHDTDTSAHLSCLMRLMRCDVSPEEEDSYMSYDLVLLSEETREKRLVTEETRVTSLIS
jgi:hypothetical protein